MCFNPFKPDIPKAPKAPDLSAEKRKENLKKARAEMRQNAARAQGNRSALYSETGTLGVPTKVLGPRQNKAQANL